MCKFATECINKMNVLVASLANTLGEDTAGLAMRVGIHRYVCQETFLSAGWLNVCSQI